MKTFMRLTDCLVRAPAGSITMSEEDDELDDDYDDDYDDSWEEDFDDENEE